MITQVPVPEPLWRTHSMIGDSPQKIAVIGGGASGALVCARLIARIEATDANASIEWIGNESTFGLGLAYGTREPTHLLNVPARGMSAFPERPEHFLEWLAKKHPELNAKPESFVPRLYYGEYLTQLVPSGAVHRHQEEVLDVVPMSNPADSEKFRVILKTGREIISDQVVLALGGLSSLPGQGLHGALRPWQIDAIPHGGRVLLIGTGLTMIDVVLSLHARAGANPITALSPRGLLPHAHRTYKSHPATSAFRNFLSSGKGPLSQSMRVFLSECEHAVQSGSDWRSVYDEVRPHTGALWSRLSERDKGRFFRHLRRYWDIHRHRIAPEIEQKLSEFQGAGTLEIRAARVSHVEQGPGGIYRVSFQHLEKGGSETEEFSAIVDCTGFTPSIGKLKHELLQALIRRKLVTVDDPPIGVSVNSREHPHVHLIGPLRRGELWESVAIPELRVQAKEIAESIFPVPNN